MSLLSTVKAVLSGFVGIRSSKETERANLKPAQVIVTGLVLALLIALGIFTLVRLLVSSQG
ncbi:hypothetical protein GCM10007860_28180 [Chitiniphilus shinanonensis]|uniref:DUF2970 domain-containing protein n=1 Tax=Chitiniphilus shinanonensis TaxID=553088 RepID=A0ABQ6BV89_9NEIS|nr:DUF2970 domain-containing protein [Chitiniphilus shinanonensis]GLS05661.1 hypothetical protein GCM10007860_28180 [Chitiniphilus shinanonensis]